MQRNRVAKVLAEFYNISGTACVGGETGALFEILKISRQWLYMHYSAQIGMQSGCGMIIYVRYILFCNVYGCLLARECNHHNATINIKYTQVMSIMIKQSLPEFERESPRQDCLMSGLQT